MTTDQKVWVLLLNWKNAKDTIECMQSILSAEDLSIKGVVVCDNGSNDGSLEKIKAWMETSAEDFWDIQYRDQKFSAVEGEKNATPPFFVLIDNGFNGGFAAGNNIGLDFIKKNLTYDYVFVLNNDTIIEPTTVSSCIEHFDSADNMGLCGCKVVYEHSRHLVQAYGGASFNPWLGRAVNLGSMNDSSIVPDSQEVEAKLDYIMGAAMMISKPCLESIGNMEEKYFLYYEEADWATRAKKAGFGLGFAKDSVVYHKEGASIGSSFDKAKRSFLADYYLVSSRVKFTAKFYPFYLPSVYAFCFFQALRNLIKLDFGRFKIIIQAMLQKPL